VLYSGIPQQGKTVCHRLCCIAEHNVAIAWNCCFTFVFYVFGVWLQQLNHAMHTHFSGHIAINFHTL